jgi:hypothetical protein
MLLAGSVAVVAAFLRRSTDTLGIAVFGGMAIVGLLAILHGARVLISPGRL